MLIRSQNKEILFNLDRLELLLAGKHTEDETNFLNCVYANGKILGKYGSKEKAIKVLDMIQMHFATSTIYLYNGTQETQELIKEVPKGQTNWCIFQMPQDEEVEHC